MHLADRLIDFFEQQPLEFSVTHVSLNGSAHTYGNDYKQRHCYKRAQQHLKSDDFVMAHSGIIIASEE